jgi:hypothetical protein
VQQPDRSRLVELLGQLGAESDEAVLAAARELHSSVKEAGVDWETLLRADVASIADETDMPANAAVAVDRSDDMKIVERLLGHKDVSDTMRSDLNDFKRSIQEGKFDKMYADYLRALAKRLGA